MLCYLYPPKFCLAKFWRVNAINQDPLVNCGPCLPRFENGKYVSFEYILTRVELSKSEHSHSSPSFID